MAASIVQLVLVCVAGYVASVGASDKRVLLTGEEDLYQVVSALQAEVAGLKSTVAALQSSTPGAGSVFVRWGRTSCPGNGSEMVYTGQMAGDKWDEYGGGSNNLCLPSDPTWGDYVDGINAGGTIYGTEIEAPDSVANELFGQPVQNQDVPCAVCRTSRPSNVMISGRATCYPGWTLEYQGYLVGSGHGWHNNADYACLDRGLEFVTHGAGSDNEHVVNVVEGVCGSLPCPPYVSGRELACVVCSK